MSGKRSEPQHGRGATLNQLERFQAWQRNPEDDGWGNLDAPISPLTTTLTQDTARSVINYNNSPDIPFDRSINPYRGCEHGCIYCFARPSHAWLGLSPGQDFESRLFYKADAVELLTKELSAKKYSPQPVALGINTDAWQPVERKLKITRNILGLLQKCRHPVSIVTKSALIERDIDILAPMAKENLVTVFISITTLDKNLAREMEPRAAAPERRLETVQRLAEAGIPVGVLVAPVIPVLTDPEMETILNRAKEAGALEAGYALLRLPHEVKDLFKDWLEVHVPLKVSHVMNQIRGTRGGKEYDATFGTRMRGTGEYAELIRKRFKLAYGRLDFAGIPELDRSKFEPPGPKQISLF